MDLFNRKKVKELERELRLVRENFERDRGQLIAYKNTQKVSDQLMEENQKLIKWIENILREFGTVQAREQHVSIPICKNFTKPANFTEDTDMPFLQEREYIEIPSITIIKIGKREF